jgi:molecular chaperone IbpA
LKNGLLHIELKRSVPEEMKPRKIAIQPTPASAKQIEGQAVN